MSARDDLAKTIYAYTPLMKVVQDGHALADVIIAAGYSSAAEVEQAKAQALRDAADVWGEWAWAERWHADEVCDDLSAVQSTTKWLEDRADTIEKGIA